MNLAIIPARGGSKRIPNKNIKDFKGQPIIAYAIQVARESGLFDDIIVSTDSTEIAKIAIEYGAKAPFIRPEKLANDLIGTSPVVKHGIEFLNAKGQSYENVCCIYATVPLLQAKYLRQGLDKLLETKADYCFSVAYFPSLVQRGLRLREDGRVEPIFSENKYKRTQDLARYFFDAGQFYWGKSQSFVDMVDIHAEHSVPLVLPHDLVQDIDTHEDWLKAEFLFDYLKERSNATC